jgi:phage shock protein C
VSRSSSGFYLNKAEGKFMGVCAGIADYLGVEALWVRVILVALSVLGHLITVPLYFIIAFLASPRPVRPDYDSLDDETYLERLRSRRARSAQMRSDVSEMDRRLADIEETYGRGSRLSSEIDHLR